MRSDRARAPLAALALLALAAPALGRVFLSRSEALELAFPGAERVQSRTFVLGDEQAERVEALCGCSLDSRLVTVYSASAGGRILGYALIDVHRVRTMAQGLLLVLEPDGGIRDLRLLAFHEPEEYAPSSRWLEQFRGRPASDAPGPGRDIHAIAGSTLTSRAVMAAVRRATALYEVLLREGGG